MVLANIASTTKTDRTTIATFTKMNAKIVKEITDLIKKLADLMPKIHKKERENVIAIVMACHVDKK